MKLLLKFKFLFIEYDENRWALYKEVKGGWKMFISNLRILK